MTKLDRWIVASKHVRVLDPELTGEIERLGGALGGAWSEVSRHIHVTPENKERIVRLLEEKGYTVRPADDPSVTPPRGRGRDH